MSRRPVRRRRDYRSDRHAVRKRAINTLLFLAGVVYYILSHFIP